MRGNTIHIHTQHSLIIILLYTNISVSFSLCILCVSCFVFVIHVGRRIPIALPNTGALARKRNSFYLRAILVICLVLFAVLQLHLINSRK